MLPYIYGKRNGIHIIDIRETLRGLLRAKRFIGQVVSRGGDVLFVGTKRQARELVQRHTERCGMHYVTERWLGGTLTNFRTIRSRLERLEFLEQLVVSPDWETGYSKKMKATLSRELVKIRRNLDGIRRMSRLPGVLVLVDVKKEINAVREARAMKIPTVCLVDTDSNPTDADILIPGNDDAMRAIELIVRELADAVEEGKRARPEPVEIAPVEGRGGEFARRPRRGREQTPSEGPAAVPAAVAAAPAALPETAAPESPSA